MLWVIGLFHRSNIHRNVKRTSLPVQSAAYGLGFGLLAVMLHSLSDFGQHLPANAALSAVSCALLLAIAHKSGTPAAANTSARAFRVPKGVSAAVLICTAGVWMWALIGANGARLAETRWDETLALEYSLAEKDWFGSDEEYIALISSAEAATTYEPDNAKYLHWLNVYRWRSMSRLTDPNTGEIRIPAEATGIVKRIADELLGAAVLCPTYGPSYCVAGQLRKSVLNDPAGADLIEKGYRLAPCDPTACFVAGVLDVEQGRIEASFGKLARAATLNGGLFREVANIYANQLERPDLALEMAGDNTGRLSYVAGILDDTGENKELVEQVRNKVVESLEQRCNEPDAPASVFASLAAVYVRRGDGEKAIEYYRRALSLKYDQVRWRLSLARLLAETGSVREALREARICLRLNPELSAAKGLIADLSVHPEVLQEKAPGS